MHGLIIDFEGIDGVGKSTQVELLRTYLTNKKILSSYYKFPQYQKTFPGKTIARFLRGEFGTINEVNPYLISLAYSMDRATVREKIFADLNDGKLVICDRYAPSNKAYQAAKLTDSKRVNFLDWLDELDYKINKMPREDWVILLDMPVEVSFQLLKKIPRKKDIYESEKSYLEKVRKVYLNLASENANWLVINCVKRKNKLMSKTEIHEQILRKFKEKNII